MSDTPNEEFRKLMRAYAGFQMATAIVVASKIGDVQCAGVVVSLFAISIPSTLAYAGFARLTPEDENRNPQPIPFIFGCAALIPSVAAISILFASASIFAAVAFPVTGLAWFVAIVILRHQNKVNAVGQEIKPPDNHVK